MKIVNALNHSDVTQIIDRYNLSQNSHIALEQNYINTSLQRLVNTKTAFRSLTRFEAESERSAMYK